MRSYQTAILEAELLASPSESVVTFLRERAKTDRFSRMRDYVDKELEAALIGRRIPLVTLALARYGEHTETLRALFQDAAPDSGLQLAILTNTVAASDYFSGFPASLFGGNQGLIKWLNGASDAQLSALFSNPNLQSTFLRDLLDAEKEWAEVDSERLARIAMLIGSNERMRTPYDDDDKNMDGYADYIYNAVFTSAWKLAERVPTNIKWAVSLSTLYERLEGTGHSIDKPLELAQRWVPQPEDAEILKLEAEDLGRGWLSNYSGVRKGLARLALKKDRKILDTLLASDDPAFRSAAYASAALSADQLKAAYEKDGELFYNMVMHNHGIWQNPVARAALRDVAWDVVKNDKHSDLSAANIYNSIRDDLAGKHPDWFKEDEDIDRPEPADLPATKGDVQQLGEAIEGSQSGLQSLGRAITAVNSRLGWVWWFSLGALVMAVFRHF